MTYAASFEKALSTPAAEIVVAAKKYLAPALSPPMVAVVASPTMTVLVYAPQAPP
jgi:hypothetical protein